MAIPPLKKTKWSILKLILAFIVCLLMFVLLGTLLFVIVPILMSQLFG